MIVPVDLGLARDSARCRAYLNTRGDTHTTDLPGWRLLFNELYGFEDVTFADVDGDRIRGLVSLYLVPSQIHGRMLVSSPFFGYGGLYADTAEIEAALLARLEEAARERDVDFIEFRLRRPLPAPYEVVSSFTEFDLDVSGTADEVWSGRLESTVRDGIAASREAPFVFSTAADPKPAHRLLSRAICDLGAPFHRRRFFDLLLKHFWADVRFSQVHLDGELVAAGVMVRAGDHLLTPYISSLKGEHSQASTYAQLWGVVEHCTATGIRTFELGRSPNGSTQGAFKTRWGATPVPMFHSHLAVSKRRVWTGGAEPTAPHSRATEAWKRLPLPVARRIGHRLLRHMP